MTTHLPEGLSPDAVDTLTELTSIITKLRAQPPSQTQTSPTTATGNVPGATPSAAPGATPAPAPGAVTGTTPLPSGSSAPPSATGLLHIKELPAATDSLKHKLQRGRVAMKTLQDVPRSITKQEGDIAEFEERRRKQIEMLTRIRDEGLVFARGEEVKGDRMIE